MFPYMAGIYEDGAGMSNYPDGMTRQDYEYLSVSGTMKENPVTTKQHMICAGIITNKQEMIIS